MRNFLYLNTFLILLLTACVPVKKSQFSASPNDPEKAPVWHSPFIDGFEKGLFRTSMHIADKHLTGISIIKRTSDSSFHFIFANEIGMTYFDMEIYKKSFRPDYIFEPINKKAFLKILQENFSIMLYSRSERKPVRAFIEKASGEEVYLYLGQNLYVWIDRKQNNLVRLAGWTNYFDAAIIKFSEYTNGFPGEIQVENPKINMVITFNLIGH